MKRKPENGWSKAEKKRDEDLKLVEEAYKKREEDRKKEKRKEEKNWKRKPKKRRVLVVDTQRAFLTRL